MARRIETRGSFTRFARLCGYEPAAHHGLLIQRLEAVARGDVHRQAVFMPPGSAKSTYASILFVAWWLAQHPGGSVIAASHTQELAERWGRRVRNLVTEHQLVLGYGLSGDSYAAGRWQTDQGGEYFAAGVGGAITGWRADLVVIDDPVRSREDADSALIRDRTWDWYRYDLVTRLKPNASIVLIQTRWHEDDLAGRALADAPGAWEVLRLPALAEEGDPLGRALGAPLWPEWFTPEMFVEAQRDPRLWSALYQQRPTPEEGDYFQAGWLKPYSPGQLPATSTLKVYGASDYAVTADGGDYTVHVVVGVDPENRMWLLDLWRRQASSDAWVSAFCDLVRAWKPIEWAEEGGQIRSGVGPFLTRQMIERKAFVFRRAFPTKHDKAVRAQSIRGKMAMQGLYVPTHAPWYADLLGELLGFPAAKHDDQVDALGLIGQLLDHVSPGIVPKPDVPEPTELQYQWVNGRVEANMSMRRIIELREAKARRDRD
jgi:predicted phage terminase large subunit-like protein